jgi:hypothetical protein
MERISASPITTNLTIANTASAFTLGSTTNTSDITIGKALTSPGR